VLYRIYPGSLPAKAEQGWVDLLFDTPLVVFAGRIRLLSIALVLAFASGFTILSIVNWTRRGQWLTKAGPFEVSRYSIDALATQVEFWQQRALEESADVDALRLRLSETEDLLDAMLNELSSTEREGDNGSHDDG